MTGDSALEAWTLFMLTRDLDTVRQDLRSSLSPIEQRMLNHVEGR